MDLFSFVLLSTLVFGTGWAIATAILYPRLRSRMLALRPALRARFLLGCSVAPPVMGLSLTLLLFFPYSPLNFAHGEHCSKHPVLGPHLLQAHLPLPEGVSLPTIAVISVTTGAALFLLLQSFAICRGIRVRRNLRALSWTDVQGARLLESDRPLALSAGFLKPQIFISSALKKGLAREQLRIVLAHERSHVRRRDSLRHYFAEAGSLLYLPWTRKLLLSDLALATEQACDEVAALETGDRLQVAETIVAVERMLRPFPREKVSAGACFIGSHSVARVESLLSEGGSNRGSTPLFISLPTATVVAVLALVEPLHHGAESLLGGLLG